MSRSEIVYNCVHKHTMNLLSNGEIDGEGIDAESIAYETKIDRANVSRELNQLWKDGKLIKFQGRPVFFLDYVSIKEEYPYQYIPVLISQDHKLSEYLKDNYEEKPSVDNRDYNPLKRIIGAIDGTLTNTVNNTIAAVSYKGKGIPVLIEGDRGTRKRNFVTAIFDYVKKNRLKDEDSKLIIIDCQEFVNNDDLFINKILGNSERKGAFEQANKGVIYFQKIHYLSPIALAPIMDAANFSYYFRVGEVRHRKLEVSIIASINDEVSEERRKHLHSAFPLIARLPCFRNRSIYEKIEMVLSLFMEEATSLQTNIVINNSILYMFLQYDYSENDRQLRNYIRFTCANALNKSMLSLNNTLHIDIEHLPLDLMSSKLNSKEEPAIMASLNLYQKDYILCEKDGRCDCFDFFKTIQKNYTGKNLDDFVSQFSLTQEKINPLSSFIQEVIETIGRCDDVHYHKLRSSVSENVRLTFLKEIYSNSNYQNIADHSRLLVGLMALVSDYLKTQSAITLTESLVDKNSNEYQCASRISEKLEINNEAIVSFIASYLQYLLQVVNHNNISILLVAKGESIAKQYKQLTLDFAKEKNVTVEAIDYRSDLQYNDILEIIANTARTISNEAGVIILADSIALSDIGPFLINQYELRCKIIYPLSYDSLISAIDCAYESYSLDEFISRYSQHRQVIENEKIHEEFLDYFTDQVLSKTLTHINPHKAVEVLLVSLDEILEELKISKSREIIVKYLSHGVHMLERVIKKEPLNYHHLKKFSNEHHNLMDIIAKSLTAAQNTFDLIVPSSEIAYLSEIFLEGVE